MSSAPGGDTHHTLAFGAAGVCSESPILPYQITAVSIHAISPGNQHKDIGTGIESVSGVEGAKAPVTESISRDERLLPLESRQDSDPAHSTSSMSEFVGAHETYIKESDSNIKPTQEGGGSAVGVRASMHKSNVDDENFVPEVQSKDMSEVRTEHLITSVHEKEPESESESESRGTDAGLLHIETGQDSRVNIHAHQDAHKSPHQDTSLRINIPIRAPEHKSPAILNIRGSALSQSTESSSQPSESEMSHLDSSSCSSSEEPSLDDDEVARRRALHEDPERTKSRSYDGIGPFSARGMYECMCSYYGLGTLSARGMYDCMRSYDGLGTFSGRGMYECVRSCDGLGKFSARGMSVCMCVRMYNESTA
jgi:hypothetical protein